MLEDDCICPILLILQHPGKGVKRRQSLWFRENPLRGLNQVPTFCLCSLSVWKKEELEREQVRGLFAIAVLASIAAYLVSRGSLKPNITPASTALFSLVDVSSIILLMFWTLYVVTAAISMTFWDTRRLFQPILRWFKAASQYCFYMGSVSTLAFAVYFIPQIIYLQIQSESALYRDGSYIILTLFLAAYIGLSMLQRRKKRSQKGPS